MGTCAWFLRFFGPKNGVFWPFFGFLHYFGGFWGGFLGFWGSIFPGGSKKSRKSCKFRLGEFAFFFEKTLKKPLFFEKPQNLVKKTPFFVYSKDRFSKKITKKPKKSKKWPKFWTPFYPQICIFAKKRCFFIDFFEGPKKFGGKIVGFFGVFSKKGHFLTKKTIG